jgi:hypothetical protein
MIGKGVIIVNANFRGLIYLDARKQRCGEITASLDGGGDILIGR